jgi:predicted ArsR family transcriptional regulator
MHILKERGQATVADLAQELDRPAVSVRHHLGILVEQGVIRTRGVQRRKSRGRPRHIYVLTETAKDFFPNGYEGLALELLKELKHSLTSEQLDVFFHRLATETASKLQTDGSQTVEERLAAATQFLSERGYLARWEQQDGGGYLLHLFNCPYAGLSEQYRELCAMDSALISELLQITPRRVAHAVAGDHRCTYLIE